MKSPLDLANVDIEITSIPISHYLDSFKKKYTSPPREHHCLILIKKGSFTYVDKNERAVAREGDIMLISKGEEYTLLYNDGLDFIGTQFYITEFDIADKDLSFLNRVNKVKHPKFYENIFIQLERYCNFFHIPQGGFKMKGKSLMYELLYNLFKEIYVSNMTPLEANLEKAKNYIDTNIKKKILIEELAAISGYSVPYFKRKFKEYYKITPGEYLMDVRINKAKAMLESKMYTITEITNECGFSSESYFSHAFKNTVGISPKKF